MSEQSNEPVEAPPALTVEDLPPREKLRAQLPAIGAILGMLALVLVAGIFYTSQRADQAQRKAARENRELLRVSTARFQYATNRSVCGFRRIADSGIAAAKLAIKRSDAALADPTSSPGVKARNRKAKSDAELSIRRAEDFKSTQVTVPYNYDCHTLPARPPVDTLPPG